jgi:hypothetical protein
MGSVDLIAFVFIPPVPYSYGASSWFGVYHIILGWFPDVGGPGLNLAPCLLWLVPFCFTWAKRTWTAGSPRFTCSFSFTFPFRLKHAPGTCREVRYNFLSGTLLLAAFSDSLPWNHFSWAGIITGPLSPHQACPNTLLLAGLSAFSLNFLLGFRRGPCHTSRFGTSRFRASASNFTPHGIPLHGWYLSPFWSASYWVSGC